MLRICLELEKRCTTDSPITCVRNLPLAEYLRRMSESHIVLDHYTSYSPGTNAFQAMALGRSRRHRRNTARIYELSEKRHGCHHPAVSVSVRPRMERKIPQKSHPRSLRVSPPWQPKGAASRKSTTPSPPSLTGSSPTGSASPDPALPRPFPLLTFLSPPSLPHSFSFPSFFLISHRLLL